MPSVNDSNHARIVEALEAQTAATEAILANRAVLERYIYSEARLRWVIHYYAEFGSIPDVPPAPETVPGNSDGATEKILGEFQRPTRLRRMWDALTGRRARDLIGWLRRNAGAIAKELLGKINDIAKAALGLGGPKEP